MTIRWMNRRHLYYYFSVILLVLAGIGLALGGLKPAVEFTGGTQLIIATHTNDLDLVREGIERSAIQLEMEIDTITPLPEGELELTLSEIDNAQKNDLLEKIQENVSQTVIEEISFQSVGPSVGSELISKTGFAVALAVGVILSYLWFQFRDWRYGFAGILAMLHDTFIVTGVFAWLGLLLDVKVDVLFVTALLTILSFSVHDTIVVFDRMRELRRTSRASIELELIADQATTQTLTRSLNNSITILIMLAALLLLGGESLRWFVAALFAGTLIGTYSSTFTALPLYVDLVRWESGKNR